MRRYLAALYRDVKISLKGTESEFTSGKMSRAILILSIPMILEMCMEALFAVVDIFFLGHYSSDAVAIVGLTETVEFIVYSICIGISMAVMAMVGRRVGEKQPRKAADVAVQTIWIALSISAILSVLGFFFAKDILLLIGADQALADYGETFTTIILCANVNVMFLWTLNAVFRGSGNAAIAMRVLWIANGINIILDPILIFGLGPIPSLGLEGAAIATTVGRGIGVLFQLYFLFRGNHSVKIYRNQLIVQWTIIRSLLSKSIGGIGQYLVSSASWIFIISIIAEFGKDAVAGYTIAFRVLMFTLLPSWGMASAAATLVGQNLGAGEPGRAEKSVWLTAKYNSTFLLIVSIFYLIFADQIVGVFTNEQAVLEYGISALRIVSIGYVFFGFGMSMSMGFNGAGDTTTPTWLNFIIYWLVQLPMAYILAKFTSLGPNGVYWGMCIASFGYVLLAIYLFRKGKWKKTII